jgi:hypothetical protein
VSRAFCSICGGSHDEAGVVCTNPICSACKRYCVRGVGCKWEVEIASEPVLVAPQVMAAAENAISHTLEEAFESWLASSELIKTNEQPGIIWKEFELFAKEKLSPVDPNKNYLQVVSKGDKMNLLDIDKEKLYRNQDGRYILLDGKKRIRIGKVAVLEG